MKKNGFRRYCALASLAGLLALSGCANPAPTAHNELEDPAQAAADQKLIALRKIAPSPELNGTTLDGKPVSLQQFRGKPILLNFYANF